MSTLRQETVGRRRMVVVRRPHTFLLEVEEMVGVVVVKCVEEGAVPKPLLKVEACGRVVGGGEGVRVRVGRVGGCEEVRCTLSYPSTNYTQTLVQRLASSGAREGGGEVLGALLILLILVL